MWRLHLVKLEKAPEKVCAVSASAGLACSSTEPTLAIPKKLACWCSVKHNHVRISVISSTRAVTINVMSFHPVGTVVTQPQWFTVRHMSIMTRSVCNVHGRCTLMLLYVYISICGPQAYHRHQIITPTGSTTYDEQIVLGKDKDHCLLQFKTNPGGKHPFLAMYRCNLTLLYAAPGLWLASAMRKLSLLLQQRQSIVWLFCPGALPDLGPPVELSTALVISSQHWPIVSVYAVSLHGGPFFEASINFEMIPYPHEYSYTPLWKFCPIT
jgi:hypothetical protein